MFDWDDLRIFLAAARSGSLSAGGQRLGVDAATVGRRIARLESTLKATLMVRSPSGLQLTAAGAQLFEIGLDAEAAMTAAARAAHPDLVAGTLRISASEGFGASILAPALPNLARAHPSLRIHLAATAGFLSPSRREVDMAITLGPPQAHRLFVEPLTHYQLALYASARYLEEAGVPQLADELLQHRIVGYVDDLIYAPELRYLEEVRPGLSPTLASSSIRAQREILLAGGGIGVLPCFMSAGLVRVLPEILLIRRFWISIHPEVHQTARARAVRRWLQELVRTEQVRLTPYGEMSASNL